MKFIKEILPGHIRSVRFYRYFFSYIAMLMLILALLGIFVYKNFIQTLKQEVENSNVSALKQVVGVMDIRMRELDRTVLDIDSNQYLRPYKAMTSGYDAMEAVREIKKYKTSNEFVYDIIVYHEYQEKRKFFCFGRDADFDMFFNFFYRYENWSGEEFRKLLSSIRKPGIRPVETVNVNKTANINFATYIYPLPLGSSKPTSAVIYMIEEGTLKAMVKDVLKNYKGYVFILDESGKPVIQLGESGELSPVDILADIKNAGITKQLDNVDIQGENYSVVTLSSDYNQWSYITALKTNQFLGTMISKQSLFVYAFFVALILGVIMAFSLAVGNYIPLKRIADAIDRQKRYSGSSGYKDELKLISRSIDEFYKENRGLMSKLQNKADMIRDQLLLRLLKQKDSDFEELRGMCEIAGIKLNCPFFKVLYLLVDDFKDSKAGSSTDAVSLLKFSIRNAVEELALEIGQGYAVELEDTKSIALLLNFQGEFGKERYISGLAFKAMNFFKQHFNITMTIGVGNTVESMVKIPQSYEEAKRAVYYRLVKGRDNVIFYEDIKDVKARAIKYPIDKENELIMAIKQGRILDVERIAREFSEYISSQEILPESAQYICFSFINAVVKMMDLMGIEENSGFENFDREKEELFIKPFDTIEEMCSRLTSFCKRVSEHIESSKESKNFSLRDKILNIINERYNDSTLTLESIAAECGISTVYISRYFKDQTGYTLMKYIDMERMKKAKELLKETQQPIKDILNQVGYIDESNFMRKFRKNEGMTPMQYRSVVKKH